MRATVIAGKIGPAFNGAYVSAHGSVDFPIDAKYMDGRSDSQIDRDFLLTMLFVTLYSNAIQGIEHFTDGAVSSDRITLGDIRLLHHRSNEEYVEYHFPPIRG